MDGWGYPHRNHFRGNSVKRALALCLTLLSSLSQAQIIVNAFPNLSFRQPVHLTSVPDSTRRLVVVQQNGYARIFPDDTLASATDTLLDLSGAISSSGGEEGFLGLAFHPQFTQNGYVYVNYTAPSPLRTVIRRFTVPPSTPNHADPGSGFTIIEILQPYANHNGGMLAFGPDGYLYIGMGDGGSGGDPQNNAQNRSVLLGKFLRLDVDDTTGSTHYAIPPDNPYAGNSSGFREEIWAYGFRNPWRFSFDPQTGTLWAGDVGQNTREEIDIVYQGKNYGWRIMEGTFCYNPPSGCDTTGLVLPVIDYGRSLGYSVTGGYVYRGTRRTDLVGSYIYADYGSGRIWSLRDSSGTVSNTLLTQAPFTISAFGTDSRQELYILAHSLSANTSIYRFVAATPNGVERATAPVASSFTLEQNVPNPFNPSTVIRYTIAQSSEDGGGGMEVRLVVYDLLGREVAVLAEGRQGPGTHDVQFDASGLSSGLYFYRLTAGPYTESRKMVLMK
jgi:hypothetical protein